MKRRIFCTLMGIALIASLCLPSFTSPREASALPGPSGWPSACEVYDLLFLEAARSRDYDYAALLSRFMDEIGCPV